MLVAEQILDSIAPQFSAHSDKATFIALASMQTNPGWFNAKTPYAVALRAAHLMSLQNDPYRSNGESGAITQKKEGDLSINYAAPAATVLSGGLELTTYGRQLLSMINSSNSILGVTGNSSWSQKVRDDV